MPQGMPPVQAAHGGSIDHLVSNLGQHYDGGGIVAFNGEEDSDVPTPKRKLRQYTLQEQGADWEAQRQAARDAAAQAPPPEARYDGPEYASVWQATKRAKEAAARNRLEEERTRNMAEANRRDPNITAEIMARLGIAPSATPGARTMGANPFEKDNGVVPPAAAPAATPAATRSPQALALLNAQKQKPRPPAAAAAEPPAPPVQGTPYDRMDATRRADFPSDVTAFLQNKFGVDKDATGKTAQKAYEEAIGGAPDYSVYDRAAQALEKRQRQFDAPETGISRLMEYLQQIALAPKGVGSLTAGAMGAQKVKELQQNREQQQFDLDKQILEQQQKKGDAKRAYAKEVYGVNTAAAKEAGKEAYDAAIALNKSEDEAKRLQQQAELKYAEMAQDKTIREAEMKNRVVVANIGAANAGAGADSREKRLLLDSFKTRIASIDKELAPLLKMPFGDNKVTIATLQAEKAALTKALDLQSGIATMMPAPGADRPGGTRPPLSSFQR
jgi:hypothetical protein